MATMELNDKNVIKTVECNNIYNLVKNILSLKNFSQFVYRGESSSKYKLVPSAFRYDGREKVKDIARMYGVIYNSKVFFIDELSSLFHFYRKANEQGLPIPYIKDFDSISEITIAENFLHSGRIKPEYFELMALAQHYGIPTRFLDWSCNFPTALFFAVYNALKKECKREQESKKEYDKYIEDNIVVWAINREAFEGKHCEFRLIFITPPYCNNENLKAQKELFSYLDSDVQVINSDEESQTHHNYYVKSLDQEIISSISSKETLLYRFVLPYSSLPSAYKYLTAHNYTYSRLFPGYANIVQELREEKEFMRLINRRAKSA